VYVKTVVDFAVPQKGGGDAAAAGGERRDGLRVQNVATEVEDGCCEFEFVAVVCGDDLIEVIGASLADEVKHFRFACVLRADGEEDAAHRCTSDLYF
jgi:hypothetical protein